MNKTEQAKEAMLLRKLEKEKLKLELQIESLKAKEGRKQKDNSGITTARERHPEQLSTRLSKRQDGLLTQRGADSNLSSRNKQDPIPKLELQSYYKSEMNKISNTKSMKSLREPADKKAFGKIIKNGKIVKRGTAKDAFKSNPVQTKVAKTESKTGKKVKKNTQQKDEEDPETWDDEKIEQVLKYFRKKYEAREQQPAKRQPVVSHLALNKLKQYSDLNSQRAENITPLQLQPA